MAEDWSDIPGLAERTRDALRVQAQAIRALIAELEQDMRDGCPVVDAIEDLRVGLWRIRRLIQAWTAYIDSGPDDLSRCPFAFAKLKSLHQQETRP